MRAVQEVSHPLGTMGIEEYSPNQDPGKRRKKKAKEKFWTLSSFTAQDPLFPSHLNQREVRGQRSSVQEISLDCAQWHSPRDQFAKAPSKTEKTKKTVGRSKHITTCTLILLMPGSTVTSIISKPRVRSQHDLGYSLLKSKIWRKGLSCKKGTVKFC